MARQKPPLLPDCERKKRRIGIWRRGGSIYVNLAGDVIREKSAAVSWSIQDETFLKSVDGGLGRLARDTSVTAFLILDF
jgi:hypothetical protein